MPDSTPAYIKAHTTGRWAEILFRALSTRVAKRWQFVAFRGKNKGEWRGVVDLLALRKSTAKPDNPRLKAGDLFDILLIQIKGGTSRLPTRADRERLREVAQIYSARDVVLFEWKKGVCCRFSVLDLATLEWQPTSAEALFG